MLLILIDRGEIKRWHVINVRNPSEDEEIPLSLDNDVFEYGRAMIVHDDLTAMSSNRGTPAAREKANLRDALMNMARACINTSRHKQVGYLTSGHLYKDFKDTRYLHNARWHVHFASANKRTVTK